MNANLMFVAQITEKTGITYDRMVQVYQDSGLEAHEDICQLFMDKFQMSFGFANTLAEIIKEEQA